MNRTELQKLATEKGWKVEICGSFHDGYEAEVTAPEGHVIFGTDSDFQFVCIPEACPIAELIEEVRYIIQDLGSENA